MKNIRKIFPFWFNDASSDRADVASSMLTRAAEAWLGGDRETSTQHLPGI
jgi:hypothetical protein